MSMLSRFLENSLHRAMSNATERGHEYATLEHLLLALTDDQDAVSVLRACGVEMEKLQGDLIEYLDNELDMLVTESLEDPKPTAGFQRVLQTRRNPCPILGARRGDGRQCLGGHVLRA